MSLMQETLTGFKWMGNRARELMDQGKTVLFAFEEAIGTLISTHLIYISKPMTVFSRH